MFKKSAVLICILFVLLSACLFPLAVLKGTDKPSYNSFGKSIVAGDTVYYLDAGNGGMRLFSLDQSGKVNAVFADPSSHATDFYFYEGEIYVLLNDVVRRDGADVYRAYRVRTYTDQLVPNKTTASFEINPGEKAVDLCVEKGRLFISTVSLDATFAEAYSISFDEIVALYEELKEAAAEGGDEETEEPKEVKADCSAESIYLVNAGYGRFLADAAYRNGDFYIRQDSDPAEGPFAHSDEAEKAVNKAVVGIGEKVKLSTTLVTYWIAGTAIGLIVLIICFIVFRGRTKMVYVGLLLEAIILGLIVAFYFGYSYQKANYLRNAKETYAASALASLADEAGNVSYSSTDTDWYDSDSYRRAQWAVGRFLSRDYNDEIFEDAFLVSTKSSVVICSAYGRNNEPVEDIYGKSALWSEIGLATESKIYSLDIAGRSYEALAVMKDEGSSVTYIGIIKGSDSGTAIDYALLRNLLVLFIVASAVTMFVLWLTSADIKRFDRAISDVAVTGKSPYLKTENPVGTDLGNMWNSLRQIEKKIDHINYSSYKRYEAYYRFAPKNIEKILGKESILDVVSGDTANLRGTLAIVSNDPEAGVDARIAGLGGLLGFLKNHPDKEGVVVTDREGLSSIDLLFTDESDNTEEFAVDYLRESMELSSGYSVPSVFLYHGSFEYGVTGTEDQSRVFLISPGSSELLKLAKWFRKQRLGVVVTEDVKLRENNIYDTRYIGFANIPSSERDVRFYEVIDACPKKDRELKLEYRDKFEDAIKLFYQSDYYMARNSFSEILKLNPGDEIVRWYLFESERLLDNPSAAGEKAGAIHTD